MFEKDFMDVQSSIISICSEFAQYKADYIFAYLYMNGMEYYFNAFFRFGKETWDINELEYPQDTTEYFRQLIKVEADRFSEVFDRSEREKPVLCKMKFRCKDQKFKFEMKYKKDCSMRFDPEQDFKDWLNVIKRKPILF